MKLIFSGHDYKYAAEQIMLMMFPEERPEYVGTVDNLENSAYISLKHGKKFATAYVKLVYNGNEAAASSRCGEKLLLDKLETDRQLQKIIKLAFFKASVKITRKKPVWGALTGIRPGKMITALLEKGYSDKQAVKSLSADYYVFPERAQLCLDAAKAGEKVKCGLKDRDIALYIGIPFCPTRCAYCSFVSQTVEKSFSLIEPFLQTLYRELECIGEKIRKLKLNVVSVYIGGGTPTTLSAAELGGLIIKLSQEIDLSNVTEFTVEAGRPDTVTSEKMKELIKCGVTRVSINPQTMNDEVLKAIGRRHSADNVLDAFKMARDVGFENINMDLIAGLPGDSIKSFESTLTKVIGLDPENITVHTLSLKKGTKITLEGTKIPGEDEVGTMLDIAAKKLSAAGYVPYYLYRQKFMSGGFENVGWCKPGMENIYNILIMEELCTILAAGGGGSTKLVNPKTGRIERIFNAKYPKEYIENVEKVMDMKKQIEDFYMEM